MTRFIWPKVLRKSLTITQTLNTEKKSQKGEHTKCIEQIMSFIIRAQVLPNYILLEIKKFCQIQIA